MFACERSSSRALFPNQLVPRAQGDAKEKVTLPVVPDMQRGATTSSSSTIVIQNPRHQYLRCKATPHKVHAAASHIPRATPAVRAAQRSLSSTSSVVKTKRS